MVAGRGPRRRWKSRTEPPAEALGDRENHLPVMARLDRPIPSRRDSFQIVPHRRKMARSSRAMTEGASASQFRLS